MNEQGEPCELRDVIAIKHGYAFSSDHFVEDGEHVLLTPGNFREEGGFRWLVEKQKFYSGPLPNNFVLAAGDMLIAMTEQAPGLLGSTFFVPGDRHYLHNQRLGLIQIIDPNRVDAGYLHYWFSSTPVRRAIFTDATGTKVKHTSPDKILSLEADLPPLPEQRKIAEILRTWDEAIAACERLIASKQRRLVGARQTFFAPTRPGADPDAAASWDETTLGAIFTEIGEPNPGLGPDSVITVGKYAIRRQVEHFTRSVASANLGNYQLLTPGDFVYDPMSAYYGAIGRYPGNAPGIVSPAYTVIRLAEGINPAFIEALLKSHYIAFELENRSSQGNREGKRRILRSDEFSSIPFMLPPRAEQDRIAAVLGEIGRDLELSTKSRDALQKQKRGLMQKLLTGEWRVKVKGEAAA